MRKHRLGLVLSIFALAIAAISTGNVVFAQMSPDEAQEKVGVQGTFVRVATTNDGWVTLGYRIANESVGKEWMLLEVGMTVPKGTQPTVIRREGVYLVTPGNTKVALASQKEYQDAQLAGLDAEANRVRDSIDYFPSGITQQCRLGFFADLTHAGRGMKYDQAELNDQTACFGRVYFHLPDGIEYGVYNFDVEFAESTVRVPFKIMTNKEAKAFRKEWKKAQKEAKNK